MFPDGEHGQSDTPNLLSPMFEIILAENRGFVLQISDDMVANEFEVYLKEQRYVFFERRPESKCIRFLFGEASCEKAVDDLVKAFVEFQKSEDEGAGGKAERFRE